LMAGLCWKRRRRAAIASLICAGANATNTLLTDFPGGVADVISFPTHLKVDMGLAAMCSALPSFMGFDDEVEAKYLRAMGMGITAVAALTESRTSKRRLPRLRRIA